ncbi:MAG: hydrogenase formation protein HypD [Phycisphaerae bacterium]
MDKFVARYCEKIHNLVARRGDTGGVQLMEVCGTHTMSVARNGLRSLLPEGLRLVSGPGCPVCVTDQSYMDWAVALAKRPGVVIATYGDMVRVPGRNGSLADARAAGGAVEVVYSAEKAVEYAAAHPDKQVVFLAVGFETTAPGTALALRRAGKEGVENFSVLTAHKLIVPAMKALLAQPDVRIDGFLCPGHVSVILGWGAFEPVVREYSVPCVVAGFDPAQILSGIAEILRQLDADAPAAGSVYPAVTQEGNPQALELLDEVFTPADAKWRALGVIPDSGLELSEAYAHFDAAERFDLPPAESYELPGCRCGDVICGRCRPQDCGLFGTHCTPRNPVGPCMVSSEGACAAAFKYEAPLAIT